jgi:hypothetical protein
MIPFENVGADLNRTNHQLAVVELIEAYAMDPPDYFMKFLKR